LAAFFSVFLIAAQMVFSQPAPDIEMVLVRGGRFRMGCQSAMESCINDERPIREVQLNSFWIGKYPITQGQWQAVMGTNPSVFTGDPNRPVENVSWDDVQAFITKLNQMTGRRYRLPTEAEWEYAARGGQEATGSRETRAERRAREAAEAEGDAAAGDRGRAQMFFGHRFLDDVAWYSYNSGGETHPVGGKNPNELGMYDVIGNVWEWVSDRYDRYYYRNSPLRNPPGPRHGDDRVYRGNSFRSDERYCRLSIRNHAHPGHKSLDLGFRLVRPQ
jgi:formylglycine-generating enzyme required for sulfatase activity